jgi:hypothetical protein
MSPQQFLRVILVTVVLLAMAAPAQMLQKPTFAILNLPSGVYLQMDVTGLSGSEEPFIDTVHVLMRDGTTSSDDGLMQAKAALMVIWGKAAPATPSETTITEAQIVRKLDIPYRSSCTNCTDTLRALRVDTISIASYSSSAVVRQIAPPHVNAQSLTPRNHCLVKYALPACMGEEDGCRDQLVQEFVQKWKAKSYAAILEPSPIRTLVYVSPWSQTTGKEDFAGIATPLIGNRDNWIGVARSRLATDKILKQPTGPAPNASAVALLPVWNIPTGAVRYIYNRTASPELKILEDTDRRVIGNLLKIGKTLDVSRNARPNGCLAPVPDTTMALSSWLVLADSASEGAIEQAMTPNSFPFGSPRSSAWKIAGDTVWLDGSTTIPLADLLAAAQGTTGVRPNARVAGFRLARTGDGFVLALDRDAEVRVTGASGQILSDWTPARAGRHALPTTAAGIAFAQVRAVGIRATFPLVR